MTSVLSFEDTEIELPRGIGYLLVSGEIVKREDIEHDYVLGYSWQELSAQVKNDDGTFTKVEPVFFSFFVPGTLNYGAFPTKEPTLETFIMNEVLYLEGEGKLLGTWEEEE
jgi:hypothetical protein